MEEEQQQALNAGWRGHTLVSLTSIEAPWNITQEGRERA